MILNSPKKSLSVQIQNLNYWNQMKYSHIPTIFSIVCAVAVSIGFGYAFSDPKVQQGMEKCLNGSKFDFLLCNIREFWSSFFKSKGHAYALFFLGASIPSMIFAMGIESFRSANKDSFVGYRTLIVTLCQTVGVGFVSPLIFIPSLISSSQSAIGKSTNQMSTSVSGNAISLILVVWGCSHMSLMVLNPTDTFSFDVFNLFPICFWLVVFLLEKLFKLGAADRNTTSISHFQTMFGYCLCGGLGLFCWINLVVLLLNDIFVLKSPVFINSVIWSLKNEAEIQFLVFDAIGVILASMAFAMHAEENGVVLFLFNSLWLSPAGAFSFVMSRREIKLLKDFEKEQEFTKELKHKLKREDGKEENNNEGEKKSTVNETIKKVTPKKAATKK